jgi:hypothetical protein
MDVKTFGQMKAFEDVRGGGIFIAQIGARMYACMKAMHGLPDRDPERLVVLLKSADDAEKSAPSIVTRHELAGQPVYEVTGAQFVPQIFVEYARSDQKTEPGQALFVGDDVWLCIGVGDRYAFVNVATGDFRYTLRIDGALRFAAWDVGYPFRGDGFRALLRYDPTLPKPKQPSL